MTYFRYILIASLLIMIPLEGQMIYRYGTTAANFLEIGVGSDGNAMGEAYVAVTDGLSSIYWNPAGLASLEDPSVSFMMQPWIVDINMLLLQVRSSFQALGI